MLSCTGKTAIQNLSTQLKPNLFGLSLAQCPAVNVLPGQSQTIQVAVQSAPEQAQTGLQGALASPICFVLGLKCSVDLYFADVPCELPLLFVSFTTG